MTNFGLAAVGVNSPRRDFSEFVGGEVWFNHNGPPRFECCKGGGIAAGPIIIKLLIFVILGTVPMSFAGEHILYVLRRRSFYYHSLLYHYLLYYCYYLLLYITEGVT
jgi:hypothetical protein